MICDRRDDSVKLVMSSNTTYSLNENDMKNFTYNKSKGESRTQHNETLLKVQCCMHAPAYARIHACMYAYAGYARIRACMHKFEHSPCRFFFSSRTTFHHARICASMHEYVHLCTNTCYTVHYLSTFTLRSCVVRRLIGMKERAISTYECGPKSARGILTYQLLISHFQDSTLLLQAIFEIIRCNTLFFFYKHALF